MTAHIKLKRKFEGSKRARKKWDGPDFKVLLLPGQRQCPRCGIPHRDKQFTQCVYCRLEFRGISSLRIPGGNQSDTGFCMFASQSMRFMASRVAHDLLPSIIDRYHTPPTPDSSRFGR